MYLAYIQLSWLVHATLTLTVANAAIIDPEILTSDYQDSDIDYECGDDLTKVSRPCMCGFLRDQQIPDVNARVVSSSTAICTDGFAGDTGYPCKGVDLMSFLPLSTFSARSANDIWGWTDTVNKREYAIMGVYDGQVYVDITDPVNPRYVGKLSSKGPSQWGDIKTFKGYAFSVSENSSQGMQILDLSQLMGTRDGSVLKETAHYAQFGNAHNIAINEETGFAYIVGSRTCSGGLHMININNPSNPSFAGCYSDDGYTHDVQCVLYKGDDSTYRGREICFASNEDTFTIVDVTNKGNPILLSRTSYKNVKYTHQGWLTEDHDYFLLGDEQDEMGLRLKTTTYVFNVKNLRSVAIAGVHTASTAAIDHNQYVKGNYSYQANYRAGLRILEMTNIAAGQFKEVAYFDIYPNDDNANFNGAWSVYPYFESGTIIISGIESGLFVLKKSGSGPTSSPTRVPTKTSTRAPTKSPVGGPPRTPRPTVPTRCSKYTDNKGACRQDSCCQWSGRQRACWVQHKCVTTNICSPATNRKTCKLISGCCKWDRSIKTCGMKPTCSK